MKTLNPVITLLPCGAAVLALLLLAGCEPDAQLVQRIGKLEEDVARYKGEAAANGKQAEIWKAELDKVRRREAEKNSSGSSAEVVTTVRGELEKFRTEINGNLASLREALAQAQRSAPVSNETVRPRPDVPPDVNYIEWQSDVDARNRARANPAPTPPPAPAPPPQSRQLAVPDGIPAGSGNSETIEIRWPEER